MRILFFCWEYPPAGSGIGRYIREMASALRDAGHFTLIVTSRVEGLPKREALENGLILRIFDGDQIRSTDLADAVVRLAKEHRIDWIEGVDHWGESANLLRLKARPPVVIKMHYNDALECMRYAPAHYRWQRALIALACLRQWRSIRAERFSLGHGDALTACSDRILESARAQKIALPEQTAVLPNPIRMLPGWHNEEADRPTVLFVGRLDFGKGVPHLPALMERLARAHPEVVLEVAGGDTYARGIGSVEKWFEQSTAPLRKRVRMLGTLDPDALDAAYRRAWVVVVPSLWDTFPHVVLESMVRGKALVTTPNGGMPEMVRGTFCPIHDPASAEFSDAVKSLLDDTSRRQDLGRALRARAHTAFAPEHVAETYIERITACLDRAR